MMLGIDSKVLEFLNIGVIRSMESCLNCLDTGRLDIVLLLDKMEFALVPRGNVHSLSFHPMVLEG